jgi:hypothetical protein
MMTTYDVGNFVVTHAQGPTTCQSQEARQRKPHKLFAYQAQSVIIINQPYNLQADMKALQQSMRPCCQPRFKHVAVASLAAAHARKLRLCRWAPDSRDEAVDGSNADSSSINRDPKQSRRLINQLLQIQSLSSLQSIDISTSEEHEVTTGLLSESTQHQEGEVFQSTSLSAAVTDQKLPSSSSSSNSAQAAAPVASSSSSGASSGAYTLFDDPASEYYDPLVLDML